MISYESKENFFTTNIVEEDTLYPAFLQMSLLCDGLYPAPVISDILAFFPSCCEYSNSIAMICPYFGGVEFLKTKMKQLKNE